MIDSVRLAAARDERRLARIEKTTREVLQVKPTDYAVLDVQSNATDSYGFDLCNARIQSVNGELSDVAPGLIDKLSQALYADLSSLAWRGLMGEDKFGHVLLTIPGTPPASPIGTWIQVDVDLLHSWLSQTILSFGEEITRAHEKFDITAWWGMPGDIDHEYADELSNLLSDLPDGVMTSTLGAVPDIDGTSRPGDPAWVRVHVRLDEDLALCGPSKAAERVIDSDKTLTGPHPEIQRVVNTVVNIVEECNALIDALIDRFGH